MKKLILMLTLLTGLSAAAFAKDRDKSPEKRAAHITKMLKKKLKLSADQTVQVNSIMLTQAIKMDSLKNNLSPNDKRLNKLSRRSIMLNTDDNLNYVLNAEQKKAYESWKAEHKEKMQARKNPNEKTEG